MKNNGINNSNKNNSGINNSKMNYNEMSNNRILNNKMSFSKTSNSYTKQHIFLSSPHMSNEGYEKQFIKEAFDTNWIAPLGKNVNEFEKEMCQKLNVNDAVALSAGTAAIHLAVKLLGIHQGDIVFCQSLTFAASVNPVIYEKAVPVFIDSDEESWNMSPVALEKAFIKYQKMGKMPKAVIVVNLYGMAAELDEILQLCNQYQVPLIEDAAESLGTKYKGKFTGSFGKFGIISFNGNKIITSSGGGMLLCNGEGSKEHAREALFLATQAREPERYYEHKQIGYNYRMSNIVAGIGRGQLRVLEQRVQKKRYINQFYRNELGSLAGVSFQPENPVAESNCWLTVIELEEKCGVKPIDIIEALEGDDVESRPVWKPMHLQPVFKEYDYIDNNKVAERLFLQGICLPSDTKMTDDDLYRVCSVIKQLW